MQYSLCFKQVFDQDIGQDKRLGIAKYRLIDLEPETPMEVNLNLLSSLDTLKVKDKKDRGSVTIKVDTFFNLFFNVFVFRCLLNSIIVASNVIISIYIILLHLALSI